MESKVNASSFGWPSQAITQSKEASEIQVKQAAERRSQKAAAERKAQEAELLSKNEADKIVKADKPVKVAEVSGGDNAKSGAASLQDGQAKQAPAVDVTV